MIQIHPIPVWQDNYTYVIEADSGVAAVVDPTDADETWNFLRTRSLDCRMILATHSHHDHIAGLAALKAQTGATVIGAADAGIPGLDQSVREGERIPFDGGWTFEVLDTPGHGARDESFLLRGPDRVPALFCGDTLFVSGCGRVLQGSGAQLWQSLQKLRALPTETEVYCGHEYTEENLRFALSQAPNDPHYRARLQEVQQQLADTGVSVPSTIGQERTANPFLRCDELNAFIQCRKQKDAF